MAFAYCPDCAGRVYLGRRPWVSQPAACDYCDAELEVVSLNPPRVDWADSVTEDAPEEEEWELELEEA
jgi:lysine biosynthesis protein LysW